MSTLQELFATSEFRKEAERMFFEAMRENGWAFGTHSDEPYKHGSWVITDEWSGNDINNWSAGKTEMFYAGVKIWIHQYYGQYAKKAIPCVMAALREAYTQNEFNGGRGRYNFFLGDMIYQNSPREFDPFFGSGTRDPKTWKEGDVASGFSGFCGEERVVISGTGALLGFHWYHGGFLLEPHSIN